jgi:hypothetical protein
MVIVKSDIKQLNSCKKNGPAKEIKFIYKPVQTFVLHYISPLQKDLLEFPADFGFNKIRLLGRKAFLLNPRNVPDKKNALQFRSLIHFDLLF